MDPEDQQPPNDDGADRQGQRHGESTQGVVGSPSEPAEPEHDHSNAPQDDRAVHQGFEVIASVEPLQQVSDDRTHCGADQRRPRRPRPADEKD